MKARDAVSGTLPMRVQGLDAHNGEMRTRALDEKNFARSSVRLVR